MILSFIVIYLHKKERERERERVSTVINKYNDYILLQNGKIMHYKILYKKK